MKIELIYLNKDAFKAKCIEPSKLTLSPNFDEYAYRNKLDFLKFDKYSQANKSRKLNENSSPFKSVTSSKSSSFHNFNPEKTI